MERMTLREAAQRTARSITTLRRYIRSGRLRAEKRFGRFGPEYYLAMQDLREAGLAVDQPEAAPATAPTGTALAPAAPPPAAPAELPVNAVPVSLFQELQMKHEQLLVQYGMIRAAGVQSIDLKDRLERAEAELARARQTNDREIRAQTLNEEQLDQQLREAHLELEGRALEIAALKEKVRGLEMLTRNAVTTETIDQQFDEVVDQSKKVHRMRTTIPWPGPRARPSEPTDDA